jgi:hypothetical protein
MTVIEDCCKCMKAMIDDGTIQPFTAFGHEMAEIHVRGRDGEVTNYNEIKYCPFCGKPIRIRDESKLNLSYIITYHDSDWNHCLES